MLKQFLAFGLLTTVSGCTINITAEREHEGFEHEEWREECLKEHPGEHIAIMYPEIPRADFNSQLALNICTSYI